VADRKWVKVITQTNASNDVRENRANWIAALRSGNYLQARQALRRLLSTEPEKVGYCCLGVAEDLRGCRWNTETSSGNVVYSPVDAENGVATSFTTTLLTPNGEAWLGLQDADPQLPIFEAENWTIQFLSVLNDSGLDEDGTPWTFTQIADAVEPLPLDWDGTAEWCRGYVARKRNSPGRFGRDV